MSSSCIICTEKLNKSNHAPVECPYCSFSACRTCCQTYIVSQQATICMNGHRCSKRCGKECKEGCEKEWSREFVVKNFAKSFVSGEWKKMREKVGLDTQKALLPATLGIIEERKEMERLRSEIAEVSRMINDLTRRRQNLRYELAQGGSVIKSTDKQFVRCCSSSTCRGYLDQQWKCGLCEKKTCSECNTIKYETHECNEDDKASFGVLKKDTKPCPKCQTGIFKITGCDQMWCTQCHTGFSWQTGRIETNIHNPHFFEFMKNSTGAIARNPRDIECGREIDTQVASRIIRLFKNGYACYTKEHPEKKIECDEMELKIRNILQKTFHINIVEIRKYETDNVADHLELRVSYLRQEIDEKGFASRIQKNDKAFEKKKDIYNILRLVVQTITDVSLIALDKMQEHITGYEISELGGKYCREVDGIIVYANDLLRKHSVNFGCVEKMIDMNAIGGYGGDVLVTLKKEVVKVVKVVKVDG